MKKMLPPNKYFRLKNGDVIRSLYEFLYMLPTIDDNVYSYHVNAQKNDFATWIKYALDKPNLAEEILGKSKEQVIEILKSEI